MSRANGVQTLQQIIETDYSESPAIIEHLLDPGEVGLFIARQKEGKSMLTLQMATDVSRGEKFLGRYQTENQPVLYVDYENRPHRLKQRALSLGSTANLGKLHFKAYALMSQRDVGLFRAEFDNLKLLVKQYRPGLLILDPLRFALAGGPGRGTVDESLILRAIENIWKLGEVNPSSAILLVHHIKKTQDFRQKLLLADDPFTWVEQCYGSQALLAHVDAIWGFEQDEDGYTFATVSRSHDQITLKLEQQEGSKRLQLCSSENSVFSTPKRRELWDRLPETFSNWRALRKTLGCSYNLLQAVIGQAMEHGLLAHNSITKEYRKVQRGAM